MKNYGNVRNVEIYLFLELVFYFRVGLGLGSKRADRFGQNWQSRLDVKRLQINFF